MSGESRLFGILFINFGMVDSFYVDDDLFL